MYRVPLKNHIAISDKTVFEMSDNSIKDDTSKYFVSTSMDRNSL